MPAGGSEYTVVLRASSSARFLPEEGWEQHFLIPGLAEPVRTRAFTRWVADGSYSLPRELVIEVKGLAGSLDEAGSSFSAIARPIANMIAFVANVRVGPVEAHLAFDSHPDKTERQLLEVFLPDERGAVAEGRIIRRHLLEVACPAALSMTVDASRVSRALRQYELALREWHVGGEWLALSHLWIAVENLTEAVLRKTKVDLSKTDQELAEMLEVVTDDPDRPRWRQVMREQIREQVIFDGDHGTYLTAKRASDGLEHGFLELDEVARHAIASAETTFMCVRHTIIDLLDMPREIGAELMEIKPKDVQSARKAIRGQLIGAAADPAAPDHFYPLLEWSSSIDAVVREGATFQVRPKERITVRTNPAVQFRLDRIEMVGRLTEGEQSRELTEDEVQITQEHGVRSIELMKTVMPLVDAAVAAAADTPYDYAHVMAFNLFGQGVAFFQGAQALIVGFQPAEALLLLRGLALIAARFEQMGEPGGDGLGIVLRIALESTDKMPDPKRAEQFASIVLQAADQAGVEVAETIVDPEAAVIYRSIAGEMELAKVVAEEDYRVVHLHGQSDGEQIGFRTKREPDSFTDMIASACVMVQLDLLKHAAELLNWHIDVSRIDELIAEATVINNTAAEADSPAPEAPR